MDRDARTWRRLALAGAASTGLLVVRVLVSPQTPLFRLLHPEFWAPSRARLLRVGEPGRPVAEDDLFSETWQQQVERRLAACESNAAETGELRNLINEVRAEARKWPGGM